MISGLLFSFRECLLNIRRSLAVNIMSIIIIAIALLMFGVFGVFTYNLMLAIHQVREKVDMEIYLHDDIGNMDRLRLRARIEALDGVKDFEFISKEQALKEGRVNPRYLDVLDSNPLPASFRLTFREGARNNEYLDRVAAALEQYAEVEEVVYGKDWIGVLDRLTHAFVTIALVLGGFILFASGFVVSYTIRLAYLNRRDDIEIMLLVGATKRMIRRPFVMVGILQGVLAGVLAVVVLAWGVRLLNPYLFIDLQLPRENIQGLLAAMGVFLGWLGSSLSIRYYIR